MAAFVWAPPEILALKESALQLSCVGRGPPRFFRVVFRAFLTAETSTQVLQKARPWLSSSEAVAPSRSDSLQGLLGESIELGGGGKQAKNGGVRLLAKLLCRASFLRCPQKTRSLTRSLGKASRRETLGGERRSVQGEFRPVCRRQGSSLPLGK